MANDTSETKASKALFFITFLGLLTLHGFILVVFRENSITRELTTQVLQKSFYTAMLIDVPIALGVLGAILHNEMTTRRRTSGVLDSLEKLRRAVKENGRSTDDN